MELIEIENIKEQSYRETDNDGVIRRKLIDEILRLRSIIIETAVIIDPLCPDKDSYIDGHCSLPEAADTRIIIERGV